MRHFTRSNQFAALGTEENQPHPSSFILLILTLVFLLTFVPPVLADDDDDDGNKKKPVITYSLVDEENSELIIKGKNLYNGVDVPIVFLGKKGQPGFPNIPLPTVTPINDKMIIATIPTLDDGTYLLTVKTPTGKAKFHANVGAADAGGTTGPAVAYTRWGRSDCPTGADLVYQGVVAGAHFSTRGGSNLLCMTLTPVNGGPPASSIPTPNYDSFIAPAVYGKNSPIPEINALGNSVAPCAVCRKSNTAIAIMHPGSDVCPSTFTREYPGYLMSSHVNLNAQSEYICVDQSPQAVSGSTLNPFSAPSVLYNTSFSCQTTGECPPYELRRAVTCSMCSQ